MNTQRLVVLGLALVAAGGAAFMVRGLLGGGTPKVEAHPAPQMAMSEVLVANTNLQAGAELTADQVRWQKWPTTNVDSSFITHAEAGSEEQAVKGAVVRSPIVSGQPIVTSAIVHADAAGFMAAMLTPGMRAVSITLGTDSGAGGFILPNDRVDVILTRKFGQTDPPLIMSDTILSNVRVLAVDQTYKQDKDTKTVVAKSATLELTPSQAEAISRSAMAGTLSLSLRPLGDVAEVASLEDKLKKVKDLGGPVSVIRYGMGGSNGRMSLTQEKVR
jgi:pilus assembly protein CpaB